MIATRPGEHRPLVVARIPGPVYRPPEGALECVISFAAHEASYRDASAAVRRLPGGPLRRGLTAVLLRYENGQEAAARTLLVLLLTRLAADRRG